MKVAIIGAGLSGLSCAYRLEQQGFQGTIHIYEKKQEIGGGNIFLEFVSEFFHRPIEDFFSYIGKEYHLYLTPLHTIYQTQAIGPTETSLYKGYTGHVIARGRHPKSMEKQLAGQIKAPVRCCCEADPNQLSREYDAVVVATGRLQDVPREVGVRVDRYVHFYHGIVKGSFDVTLAKLWLNDSYAPKGNGFQLMFDEQMSMVSLATPIREFDLANGWELFIRNEFGSGAEIQNVHEIRDFAIGQPNRYTLRNQIFVGNVAGGVQPALGFGLHTAILSGIYAADSICQNVRYEKLMEQHTKEFRWSLALRNALERCGNQEYDRLVGGLDTLMGRAIIHSGGINVNRYLGKVLAAFTDETRKSVFTDTLYPYTGKTID